MNAPPKLQGRISSDVLTLNELNKMYPWLPNENTIRCSEKNQDFKEKFYHLIEVYSFSMRDFNKDIFKTSGTNEPWVFKMSLFPFDIIANHWVLWHRDATFDTSFPDEMINQLLHKYISKHVRHTRFQFAWYKNPNPKSREFWHIHVFWIENLIVKN